MQNFCLLRNQGRPQIMVAAAILTHFLKFQLFVWWESSVLIYLHSQPPQIRSLRWQLLWQWRTCTGSRQRRSQWSIWPHSRYPCSTAGSRRRPSEAQSSPPWISHTQRPSPKCSCLQCVVGWNERLFSSLVSIGCKKSLSQTEADWNINWSILGLFGYCKNYDSQTLDRHCLLNVNYPNVTRLVQGSWGSQTGTGTACF